MVLLWSRTRGLYKTWFFDSMFLTRLLLLLLLLNSCPLFCEHFFALLVIIHLAFVIIYLINLAIKRVWHNMYWVSFTAIVIEQASFSSFSHCTRYTSPS
jgi:hypothetical protein